MTPRQTSLLKGLTFSAVGAIFAMGATWSSTKRDIEQRATQAEVDSIEVAFDKHVSSEARVDSTLLRLFRQHADADCIGEYNKAKRLLLECKGDIR